PRARMTRSSARRRRRRRALRGSGRSPWSSSYRTAAAVETHRMSLTQYYTATTLDGFIADPDNSLEWLFTRAREEGGPLDYGQFADAGLLDEVFVSIAPVTLGAGAPLLPRRVELRLEQLGRNGDFVAARFSVARRSARAAGRRRP